MGVWRKLRYLAEPKSRAVLSDRSNAKADPTQSLTRDLFNDTKFLLGRKPVKVIFDVGANRGDFTDQYLKYFPDASIHCFEPNPSTCETLKSRFRDNPRVNIHNVAVSKVQGVEDFYCNKESATDSLLLPAQNWKEWVDGKSDALLLASHIQAKTITLDQFCQDQSIHEIDILKIDTQGAELLVLEGAHGLLQNRTVRVIIAELLFVPVYGGQPFYYDVCSRFADYGYDLVNLYDCRYDDDTALQLKWADGVFVYRAFS